MSELEKLKQRLSFKSNLVDFKISVAGGSVAVAPEIIAAEINRALDAINAGLSSPLDFKDSYKDRYGVDINEWVKFDKKA